MIATEMITELVGPHFGVVEQIHRVAPEPDDLPLDVFAARLANTAAFAPLAAPRVASGAAWQTEAAIAACLGEAVERYAAALPPPDAILHGCFDELDGTAIDPSQFALFSKRQYGGASADFPFVPWCPSDQIGWTRARRLLANGSDADDFANVWLPAVFVWLPYAMPAGEPHLAPCLSTGLACGPDSDAAVHAALCEVIERDALSLAWLSKQSPPRIDLQLAAVDEPLREIIEQCQRLGLKLSLFDLTNDLGIPVVSAFVEGNSGLGWIISAGSACHPNWQHALRKALTEAAHCRMYVKSLLREQPCWTAGRRFANVTGFAEHARFYTSHPELRRPLDRWCNNPNSIKWTASAFNTNDVDADSQKPSSTGDLLRQLESNGYRAYYVDVTPRDVREIGLHVARVAVPGLQPLHGNHAWPHLGGARLGRSSPWFNLTPRRFRRPLAWNQFPHPWA